MVQRLLGAMLVCLVVAACGAEEEVPEPAAEAPAPTAATTAAALLPDVLEVRCRADGTTQATPRVRPGPAGVRLRVVNEMQGPRVVALLAGGLTLTPVQAAGTNVESVQALPPGVVDLKCGAPDDTGDPSDPVAPVQVEVVDAEGRWRPSTVECPDGDELGIPAQVGWTAYPTLTREQLPDELRRRTGLGPGEEVGRGGYPEQADAPLVVVRDGRVVISATPLEQDGGGWDLAELRGCESDGLVQIDAITVPEETAVVTAAADEPLADVIEVRCTADGTTVSSEAVMPGLAGVRLRVANESDVLQVVTVQSAHGTRGDGYEPGTIRETEEDLAPGPVDVACYDPNDPAQDPPSSPGYLERVAHFTVIDVTAVWIPDVLQCTDDRGFGMSASFGEDAGRPREELPDMLREWLHVRPTDEVRPAGYPQRPNGPLVVVRDGRVIARGTVAEFPSGWVIDSVEGCADEGLEP